MKKFFCTALALGLFMFGFTASDYNNLFPDDEDIKVDTPDVEEEDGDEWSWKATSINNGAVWGNAGYLAGWIENPADSPGYWWGCGTEDGDCREKFSAYKQMAGDMYDAYMGDTYNASKMVFNKSKTKITVYNEKGKKVREGACAFDMTKNDDVFSYGTLTTSEGAILWPFAINRDGMMPKEFNIGYLDDETMVLIYAEPGTGSWSECTWWSFGKEKE